MGRFSSGIVAIVASVMAVGACTSSAVDPNAGDVLQSGGTVITARVGEVFQLRVGESAQVRLSQGSDIRITLSSVAEDSRCPTGVQCVWAGNARLALLLSHGGAGTSAALNTTVEPRTASFAGHTISLVELRPQPRVGEPISQSEYVASVRLTN